ncbi:MAG: EVE domain-containing protein, partial [Mesorhizobium sp.]
MNYWLFKSEPSVFSFEALKAKGKAGTQWDGVRNYAARNNMKAMQIGDLGFFYHSNEGLNVVGIAEVCALAHPDTTSDDPRWECVDI